MSSSLHSKCGACAAAHSNAAPSTRRCGSRATVGAAGEKEEEEEEEKEEEEEEEEEEDKDEEEDEGEEEEGERPSCTDGFKFETEI